MIFSTIPADPRRWEKRKKDYLFKSLNMGAYMTGAQTGNSLTSFPNTAIICPVPIMRVADLGDCEYHWPVALYLMSAAHNALPQRHPFILTAESRGYSLRGVIC